MLMRMSSAAAIGILAVLSAASTALGQPTLFSGQTLGSGRALTSPDGHYELAMQTDGNLVLYIANPTGSPRAVFSSGTGGHPGATAKLEPTGDLVVSDAHGVPVWGSNSSATGCANLDVQDDGNLALYTAAGEAWASGTVQHTMVAGDELLPNQSLYAPGGEYRLWVGPGGRLNLSDSAGAIWRSTNPQPGSYAVMGPHGDFKVVAPTGVTQWHTNTAPNPGAILKLWSGGGMTVDKPSGAQVWKAGTGTTRAGLSSLDVAPPFVSCPTSTSKPVTSPVTIPVTTPTKPTTTTTKPPALHVRAPTSGSTTGPVDLKLPRVKLKLLIEWHWWRRTTQLRATRIESFPRGATIRITCRGSRGCPTRHVRGRGPRATRRQTFSADWRHLKRLERALRGRRFRAGDRLEITVSQPHHRTSRSEMIIRAGRKPRARTLS